MLPNGKHKGSWKIVFHKQKWEFKAAILRNKYVKVNID